MKKWKHNNANGGWAKLVRLYFVVKFTVCTRVIRHGKSEKHTRWTWKDFFFCFVITEFRTSELFRYVPKTWSTRNSPANRIAVRLLLFHVIRSYEYNIYLYCYIYIYYNDGVQLIEQTHEPINFFHTCWLSSLSFGGGSLVRSHSARQNYSRREHNTKHTHSVCLSVCLFIISCTLTHARIEPFLFSVLRPQGRIRAEMRKLKNGEKRTRVSKER